MCHKDSNSLNCNNNRGKLSQRGNFKRAKRKQVKTYLPTNMILRLFNASRWRCVYCGKQLNLVRDSSGYATLDHIVPMSRGGANMVRNVVPCCYDCNNSKGDKALLNFVQDCDLSLDDFASRYGEMWRFMLILK